MTPNIMSESCRHVGIASGTRYTSPADRSTSLVFIDAFVLWAPCGNEQSDHDSSENGRPPNN